MGLVGRPVAQRRVRTPPVVEVDPAPDTGFSPSAGASETVHRDPYARVRQRAGEGVADELAALIGVEDFGPAMDIHRVIRRGDAEVGYHGVRQTPGQDLARRPVDDGDAA